MDPTFTSGCILYTTCICPFKYTSRHILSFCNFALKHKNKSQEKREREEETAKMGFLSLLEVASMPNIQVILISLLGAFLASDSCNLLSTDSRRSLNKLVFVVFTPCLMFASLAETVTFQDILSWWFMPINVGLTFLIGHIFGWLLVKALKPKPQLHGLIIASCSSANLGNLMLILVPAICDEEGSPFGDRNSCRSIGLAYASFSMALGGLFIWTYTYQLIRSSVAQFKPPELIISEEEDSSKSVPNKDLDANGQTHLLDVEEYDKQNTVVENQTQYQEYQLKIVETKATFWTKIKELFHQIVEEISAPPTVGALLGFLFGATSFLRNLIIGERAPFHVIQESVQLLGDATIPCTTLILGGNLVQGLKSSEVKKSVIVGLVCVRFLILPVIGIGIVHAATSLGFLPQDPLFQYVLMLHYTLPPAMNISTMTQLFDVAQDECSVLFFWTYAIASLALTVWATVFLSIIS